MSNLTVETAERTFASGLPRFIVAAIVLVTPCVMQVNGLDRFRHPKVLFVLGGASVLLAALALVFDQSLREEFFRRFRLDLRFATAVLACAAVAALFAANRALTVPTLLWIAACAVFYLGALYARYPLIAGLVLLIPPAISNALLAIAQATGAWQPLAFPSDTPPRLRISAFLGNPNDVGTYLVIPALAAFALAFRSRGLKRIVFFGCAMVICGGMLTTLTLTAMAAFLAGCAAFAITRYRTRGVLLTVAALIASAIALYAYAPTRARGVAMREAIRTGAIDSILSSRLSPFAAATLMGVRDPLTGAGPGNFPFVYFDVKMSAERLLGIAPSAVNFGEVHNDFLEVFAEFGLPGLLLFAGSLWLLLRELRRDQRREGTDTSAFRYALGVAVVAGFVVVCAAQFPMQLAAPTITHLYVLALFRASSEAGE